MGPLLNERGVLVTRDAEKMEILNVFFASFFASRTPPRDSSTLEGGERVWQVDISPLVDKGEVRENLNGLNAKNPWVLMGCIHVC